MQSCTSLRRPPYDAQGGERSCTHRRRQANRENETWCRVLQHFDQLGISSDVAANRCKCLAKRAHPDIDSPRVDTAMLGQTPAGRAEHSGTMSVVDHQPGTVLLFDLDGACQIGHVAFCGIEHLDDDEAIPMLHALVAPHC